MKKLTFFYYFWIIFIAIHLLLYFLRDGMDIRMAAVTAALGLLVTFIRGRGSKTTYYVIAGFCTLILLCTLVYIIVSR